MYRIPQGLACLHHFASSMRLSLFIAKNILGILILAGASFAFGRAKNSVKILGSTTFSTLLENPLVTRGYDLVYLKNNLNPQLRSLGRIYCNWDMKSRQFSLGLYYFIDAETLAKESRTLRQNSQNCIENYEAIQSSLLKKSLLTNFDKWDQTTMTQINKTFYKNIDRFGTMSLQHGRPTDTVYVFLPGLYMTGTQFLYAAEFKFWQGSNVIVGTLPGHESNAMKATENDIGTWLTYTDFLCDIARRYGKKVIVVGQSTGATLAVRAAESGKADGIVLFQPFFRLTKKISRALGIGNLLPENLLNFNIGMGNLNDIKKIANEDQRLLLVTKQRIPSEIPVDLYVSDNDSIVSSEESLAWAARYAPHARIQHHSSDHMHISPPNKWRQ